MGVQQGGARPAARRYTIRVQGHPMSPNVRVRSGHWAIVHRDSKVFRDAVAYHAASIMVRDGLSCPLGRAHIKATLTFTKRRFYDHDNAFGVVKPCIDGLIGRLIKDDSPDYITLEVVQEVGSHRGVTLEITEILDQDSWKEATGHGKTEG